jgi:hypothetical protein
MIVGIESIKEIESKHGGQIFRMDGHYVDEFNKLSKCYTFIDPKNENFNNWSDVLYKVAEHKGMIVELDNVKMKDREKGLLNADSQPRVEQIYPKTVQPKTDNLGRPELFE